MIIRSRLFPIMKKEFIHIRRDPRSLLIIFLIPLIQMFLFGYAINMDLKDIRIGVCDLSKTPFSRDLIRMIDSSKYFDIVTYFDNPTKTEELFVRRLVRGVIIIPDDFDRNLSKNKNANIGVIADGSDANSASLVTNYLNGLFLSQSLASFSADNGLTISIRSRVFFNPDMESAQFIVPGLVAIVLIMVGALLTSVTIAREKETGTMEQILVSPIRPLEIILGKVVPYIFLAFIVAMTIIFVGHFWFKAPVNGSWVYLILFCLIYIFTSLAVGLLISTVAGTQQVAMMLALTATMLPSIMLSGFIFPIASMPKILQIVSNVVPATHFLIIIRGIMLKGAGPGHLWQHIVALTVIGLFFTLLALKRFKLKLGDK
ncbi:ABC transporter permease [bacterium]|nr:ABC transporter permease [bacterium]